MSRGSRGRKANISYVKPPEPAFLKRIKEKVGYKEGPTVETKKQALDIDEDDDERKVEKDDEKPVVVVLGGGDFSQEEAERIVDILHAEETESGKKDTKITFKKPGKRSSSTEEANTCSTSKKTKPTPLVVVGVKRSVGADAAGGDSKQVNNRSLLSFDDQEDDD